MYIRESAKIRNCANVVNFFFGSGRLERQQVCIKLKRDTTCQPLLKYRCQFFQHLRVVNQNNGADLLN